QHPDEGRLAAAIRPKKTINLAALDPQIDAVDDSLVAEALRDAAHVDHRLGRIVCTGLRASGIHRVTSTGCPGSNSTAAPGSNSASTMNTSFCRLSRL